MTTERYLKHINDDEEVYKNILGDKDFMPVSKSDKAIINGKVGYYYQATTEHTQAVLNMIAAS